jgi:hypothetical protein
MPLALILVGLGLAIVLCSEKKEPTKKRKPNGNQLENATGVRNDSGCGSVGQQQNPTSASSVGASAVVDPKDQHYPDPEPAAKK